jgi:hypothetical protein
MACSPYRSLTHTITAQTADRLCVIATYRNRRPFVDRDRSYLVSHTCIWMVRSDRRCRFTRRQSYGGASWTGGDGRCLPKLHSRIRRLSASIPRSGRGPRKFKALVRQSDRGRKIPCNLNPSSSSELGSKFGPRHGSLGQIHVRHEPECKRPVAITQLETAGCDLLLEIIGVAE